MQNTIHLFSVPWIEHRCLPRIYDHLKLLITEGQLIQVTQQVGLASCLIRSIDAHPQDAVAGYGAGSMTLCRSKERSPALAVPIARPNTARARQLDRFD